MDRPTRRTDRSIVEAPGQWAFVRQVANLPAETATGAERRPPFVVVLANGGVHHATVVKDAVPDLAVVGRRFGSLPPSSPELTPIEPVWHQATYQDLRERQHPTDTALPADVTVSVPDRSSRLAIPTNTAPRPA